jgi:hypothetical protein
MLVIGLLLSPSSLSLPGTALSPVAYADGGPLTIYRVQSGLVASDPLTSADGDTGDWRFNGSAAELGAPHSGYEDSQGMHIDVVAKSPGSWAGYFAITPLTAAKLFHAKVILPDQRPSSGLTDVAVYVQQEMFQDPRIDAMGCGADIYPTETRWTISLQAGDRDHEIVAQTIYSNSSSTSPSARECTLVTNGSNELAAYIDRQKVFSSTSMNLNMPAPFEYYVETQTNSDAPSSGSMFTGAFTDYYATTSGSIKVINAQARSIVRVIDPATGDILASETADPSGTAFLDVARYHMPIDADVVIVDGSGGTVLASTAAPVGIYGGDVFNVGSSAPEAATITVNSVDSSGNPVNGLFTTIVQGKSVVASGFTPLTFEGTQDSSYYILVQDHGTHVFDHWDDGSRFRAMFITPTTPSTTLTAHYTDNSGLGAPQSLTSMTPYTTNINTPAITGIATPGLSVQLYDGSSAIGGQVIVPASGVWTITPPAMPDGRRSIFADARNSTAVSPLSTPITMTIDTALPSVAITNSAVASGQVSLTGTSSDSLSGVRLVEVSIDNNNNNNPASPLVFGDWSSWTFATTNPLPPGTHHLTARATDVAGNRASASIDVTIPLVAPPGQSLITVNAVDASGNAINGLYTTLQQHSGSSSVGIDFTPSAFTVNDGSEYTVAVANYGSYYFDHWQDTGSTDNHRAVTTAGTSVPLIAVYRDTPLPPPPPGQSALTVSAADLAGNPISGMYTTLSMSGSTVSTGFTAAHFVIEDGQDYVVSVSDYGSHYFDHWQDTGSTTRQRVVAAGSDLALVAIYRDTPLPPPLAGKSQVTVNAAGGASGNPIDGLYTTLSQNGSVVGTGFTSAHFTLDDGAPYTISVSDYGSYYFDHWQDNGSTIRSRALTTTSGSPVTLTAIYRNTPLPTPPPGQSELTISSTDSAGNAVTGMYTTVSQNGGSSVISTGFTPFHLMVNDGQTYVVTVSNYGAITFNHWQDDDGSGSSSGGGSSSTRTITIPTATTTAAAAGSPINLVAVYDTAG